MTTERWEKLIDSLDDAGRIESRETAEFADRPGSVERVVAKTPAGRFRLSWTTEPKKVSEKALYSKRGGSTANIQIRYDATESIHLFAVERFLPATLTWERVDAHTFGDEEDRL